MKSIPSMERDSLRYVHLYVHLNVQHLLILAYLLPLPPHSHSHSLPLSLPLPPPHSLTITYYIREQLLMAALSQKFKELVATFVLGVPDDTILATLCQELVLKIYHTMSNDFLGNVCTLEQLKEKSSRCPDVPQRGTKIVCCT